MRGRASGARSTADTTDRDPLDGASARSLVLLLVLSIEATSRARSSLIALSLPLQADTASNATSAVASAPVRIFPPGRAASCILVPAKPSTVAKVP